MNYLEGEKNEWAYYREELMERTEDSAESILCSIWHGTGIPLQSYWFFMWHWKWMYGILFTILMVAAAASGFFMLYRNQNNTREIKRAEVNMNHAITLLNRTQNKSM